MKIVIVYNPRSGSALSLRQIRQYCNKHKITIQASVKVDDQFPQSLKPYLKKDVIIAVLGGDGTIGNTAGIVAKSKAILAPLPGGTLNHFSKDVGIPQDIDKAFENLAKAKVQTVDIAQVNGTVFLNNSSIGLYPSSLLARENLESKQISKWPAAVIAGIKAFARYKTYTITIEGETFATPFLFVGNNNYHLDELNSPGRRRLDQGILTVYTVASGSRLDLLKLIGWTLIGKLQEADEIRIWKTSELTIRTKRRFVRLSRDGELQKIQSPLHYKIAKKQLRIIGS